MPNRLNTFNDQDQLRAVRQDHLNPLIDYTKLHLTPRVTEVEKDAKLSFRTVIFDEAAKTITFRDGYNTSVPVNLTNIIPDEFLGVTIEDDAGGSFTEIKSIRIDDATITKAPNSSEAIVAMKWDSQVKQYQDRPTMQKGTDLAVELKTLKFDGNLTNVNITGDVATLTVPENPVEITAQVGTSVDATTIHKINITGNTAGTTVTGDTLNIIMPDIPSPQAFTQWFVGFYDTLGELESDVGSGLVTPVEKRSFAFIKDKTVTTGQFYDTWMYVSGAWTEAPVDPAVTYEQPDVAGKQGVFSIKPNSRIKIDKNGQLDLDGLTGGNFVGFFPDMDSLNKAVPHPEVDKTSAFVKNTGNDTWLFIKYSRNPSTSTNEWETFGPQASIGLVEENATDPGKFHITKPIYGIKKTDNLTLGPGGVLEIKGGTGGGMIDAEIYDFSGAKNGGMFDKIKYVRGMSYAVVDASTNTLTLEHPQRVIKYDSTFEANHSGQNYKGNIFYDENSDTWMGWATPSAPGAVATKWTKIIHEGMSDQVKALDARHPAQAPEVVPGNLGDNAQWQHNGFTYVDNAVDVGFDDKVYTGKGIYILTFSRRGADDPITTRPKYRMQFGIIEDDDGVVRETWVRMQDPTAGSSDRYWKDWVKTSLTPKELKEHTDNPSTYKAAIKFHKVVSVTAKYSTLSEQTVGGSKGGFLAHNCNLLVDNYGATTEADRLEVPYDGNFRICGEFGFSGWGTANSVNGKWQVLLRLKKKDETTYKTVGSFSYNHIGTSNRYPSLSFVKENVAFSPDDELVINLTFTEPQKLINAHPNLHLAPLRSYFMIEDMNTTAGTAIARTHRQYFSDTDRTGEVSIKVHAGDFSDSGQSAIRVYGERITRVPVPMTVGL